MLNWPKVRMPPFTGVNVVAGVVEAVAAAVVVAPACVVEEELPLLSPQAAPMRATASAATTSRIRVDDRFMIPPSLPADPKGPAAA